MITIAVVPQKILRRWDAVALVQLAQAALQLQAENDDLHMRVQYAEESADMWQTISEIERDGKTAAITQDLRVVVHAGGAQ